VRLSTKVVEETIAPLQSQELIGNDALERGTNQRILGRTLRDSGDEQIDIVN
jgi:hypothetical protein